MSGATGVWRRWALLGLAGAGGAAAAQQPSSPLPTPDVPVIVLPTPSPSPTPTPTAEPTPEPEPSEAATPAPAVTPEPAPSPTRTPAAATPRPPRTPAPQATATPTPPAPAPTAAPAPPAAAPSPEPAAWEPWLFGGLAAVLLVALWRRYRRERPAAADPLPEAGAPPPQPETGATSGPWLTLALRPVRGGLNMVTAVVDCEITIANTGSAPAEAIRTALTLDAVAGEGQATPEREPSARPLGAPFTLAPGEARTIRGVAAAPLETLPTMQAGGREMMVPLVRLTVHHGDAVGARHRIVQQFVIGVERVDSPKLAPFWLDSLRMLDQVAARPRGEPERRRTMP